jgi:hypothetical protein
MMALAVDVAIFTLAGDQPEIICHSDSPLSKPTPQSHSFLLKERPVQAHHFSGLSAGEGLPSPQRRPPPILCYF